MKNRIVVPAALICLAMASGLACKSSSSQAPSSSSSTVSSEGREEGDPGRRVWADSTLVIGSVWKTKEEIKDEKRDGILEIHNTLDRSVSVDLVGASHQETSVGDQRTGRIRVPGGSYTMKVSAPGLKPTEANVYIESGAVSAVEVQVLKSKR
jgi:hypothetical protein